MYEKPRFDPRFWEFLAENNPIGEELSAQDVADWFDWVWPRYAVRRYRNHKRAVANWWSRVASSEIDAARERGRTLRGSSENRHLEALAKLATSKSEPASDFFARIRR